MSSGHLAHVAW